MVELGAPASPLGCTSCSRCTEADGIGLVRAGSQITAAKRAPESSKTRRRSCRTLTMASMDSSVITSGLAPADRKTADNWLDFGQWEAVVRLRVGETYTFRTSMNGMALTWTARRVLALRLVPGSTHRARPQHAKQPTNTPTGRS